MQNFYTEILGFGQLFSTKLYESRFSLKTPKTLTSRLLGSRINKFAKFGFGFLIFVEHKISNHYTLRLKKNIFFNISAIFSSKM